MNVAAVPFLHPNNRPQKTGEKPSDATKQCSGKALCLPLCC